MRKDIFTTRIRTETIAHTARRWLPPLRALQPRLLRLPRRARPLPLRLLLFRLLLPVLVLLSPIQLLPAPGPAAPFPSSAAAPVQTAAPQTGQTAAADSMMDTEDNCTIGYYSRVIGVEPVVGWLVCTEGEYKGESFKLKSGRNFIGRAANMDVVLSADHSISRFKHAAVIYEPRSRQFIVTAGESRELCYLNGDVVLSNMKMEAYDVLNLGNTSLMLVPCCGKRFSWENGLEKEPEDNE